MTVKETINTVSDAASEYLVKPVLREGLVTAVHLGVNAAELYGYLTEGTIYEHSSRKEAKDDINSAADSLMNLIFAAGLCTAHTEETKEKK